jgi:hypothetical protein
MVPPKKIALMFVMEKLQKTSAAPVIRTLTTIASRIALGIGAGRRPRMIVATVETLIPTVARARKMTTAFQLV